MEKVWMEGINAPAMDQFMIDLRSGEFQQTKGHLYGTDPHYGKGMCCLGVVTERVHKEVGLSKSVVPHNGLIAYSWGCRIVDEVEGEIPFRTTALMPMPVAEYLGIPEAYLDVLGGGEVGIMLHAHDHEKECDGNFSSRVGRRMIGATTLNDALGLSFAEIADRFEETFKVDKED